MSWESQSKRGSDPIRVLSVPLMIVGWALGLLAMTPGISFR
jgi:hypothetical protein